MGFVEELIWSKNEYIFENKQYYIKLLQESDKEDFCNIMREHRLNKDNYKHME